MVAFLFSQSYPPFLFFTLYSAHFRALLFHLRKYSLFLLSAKIALFLHFQFFPFGCGYRCIEKTESKRKKNSCLYTYCCLWISNNFFCFSLTFGQILVSQNAVTFFYAPLPLPKRQNKILEVSSNA